MGWGRAGASRAHALGWTELMHTKGTGRTKGWRQRGALEAELTG